MISARGQGGALPGVVCEREAAAMIDRWQKEEDRVRVCVVYSVDAISPETEKCTCK